MHFFANHKTFKPNARFCFKQTVSCNMVFRVPAYDTQKRTFPYSFQCRSALSSCILESWYVPGQSRRVQTANGDQTVQHDERWEVKMMMLVMTLTGQSSTVVPRKTRLL